MGSLMSGWDSPVMDSGAVEHMRNRSLTKEEIEAYWRVKKRTEEEHLRAISDIASTNIMDGGTEEEPKTSLEDMMKKNGWWKRSRWAFLNEPPVMETQSNTYRSQFHIANLSKYHANHGISAK